LMRKILCETQCKLSENLWFKVSLINVYKE
jgi:hypothetical protein